MRELVTIMVVRSFLCGHHSGRKVLPQGVVVVGLITGCHFTRIFRTDFLDIRKQFVDLNGDLEVNHFP